jgi:DNA invertase Pin-like site-specific DNA recombinase
VVVDAGESAKSLDRPGLTRALAMLEDGAAEALLVVKLDRLTRSWPTWAAWSTTTSATGRPRSSA